MALHARTAAPLLFGNDLRVQILVEYYDDADPNTVLHRKEWSVPPETTSAQLSTMVVNYGKSARAAFTQWQALSLAIPQGTDVAVP